MKCPKCGHVQEEKEECEKCGIFVAKYLEKKASGKDTRNEQPEKKKSVTLFLTKDRELSLYYHTTYQMTDAGFTPIEALQHFYRTTERLTASEPFLRIEKALQRGEPASAGMKESPDYFPSYHTALIEVGEKTGTPQTFYKTLDKLLAEKITIKYGIIREMTRPAMTLGAAFFILPLPVLVSQGVFPYLIEAALPPGIAFLILFFLSRFYQSQIASRPEAPLRKAFDEYAYSRAVVREFCILQYTRSLLAMNKAGLHIMESIPLAAEASGNRYFVNKVAEILPSLQRGNTLQDALGESDVIPEELLSFISTGERSGKLDESLQRFLSMQEERFVHTLANFSRMAMGIIVTFTMLFVAVRVVSGFQAVFSWG